MIAKTFAASALVLAAALAVPHATAASLAADGVWVPFDVAFDLSGNLNWIDIETFSALNFDFVIPQGSFGTLSVVDGGFSGDRFRVTDGTAVVGETSAATNSYPTSLGLDFDSALLTPGYSQGVFTLPAGAHSISGVLIQSALDGNQVALNTTVGGVRLTVSPIPEPATLATLLAGLGLLGLRLRRQSF